MSIIGKNLNNKAGYTLIELVLLALIILIIVGVSTPQFRNTFSSLELKELSFNISRLASFAQEKAILEHLLYKLNLNTENSNYYLTRLDPEQDKKFLRLKEKYGRTFALPRGFVLKTDKKEIIFYPDGHSDKAVLVLQGKSKVLKMEFIGSLGNVKITE